MDTVTIPTVVKENSTSSGDGQPERIFSGEMTMAYVGILIVMASYYARLEDWVPGARYLHAATIGGILAYVGYLFRLLSVGSFERKQETKLFLALLGIFIIGIPFSYWISGSIEVIDDAAKALLLGLIGFHCVNNTRRLSLLLLVQSIFMTFVAWFSRGNADARYDRVEGVLNGIFENPNDLALLLAVTIPLCAMYCIRTDRFVSRIFWLGSMGIMLYVMMLTYSRTGFISFVVSFVVWVKEFSGRGGRRWIARVSIILAILLTFAIATTPYGTRVASIFDSSLDESGQGTQQSSGSREARTELMMRSLQVTFAHPLLGVGAGQFAEFSGSWHVSHNTYLQLSSETGSISLIIYLMLLYRAYRDVTQVYLATKVDSATWFLAAGLRASLCGFAVGTFFSNFAYQFFTYFLIAHCVAIHRIAFGDGPLSGQACPHSEGATGNNVVLA